MAGPLRLRHRRRMKRKEADPVIERLRVDYGMELEEEAPLDAAEAERMPVYLVGPDVVALESDGTVVPGLRGLFRYPAKRRWVTVDMGAIRFVTNGADIMAPGITDADPDIQPGDGVWIRDEKHGRPLAVGVSTQTGAELKDGTKGKVIRNLHTIGDPLWTLGHEEG